MSNLTQFFGSVPSTADTATTITGTTMQALTAGDGVRLGDNGSFAKTPKSGMRKGVYEVAYNTDRTSIANDGLNLNDNSSYIRYSPWNGYPKGIILSDGTYIQLFTQQYQSSGANQWGFRSFLTSNSEKHMHFKDAKLGRTATTSNAYYHYGCHFQEMFKDDNYIYVSAMVVWSQNNNYRYGRVHIIKMNRSNKVMEIHTKQNDQMLQPAHQSTGMVGGCGSSGTYANGVIVCATQEGNAASDPTGRLAISSHVYNTASAADLTEVGIYDGAFYTNNYGVSDLLLHDATSRTFISFESPVNGTNSKLVKKHVFAANGAITTTSVATAFTLSNFSNATSNKHFRVVKVSAGVYAAIFAEENNVWSIQKFTWDGNTTLTQTGSRIDLTLPTGMTISSANTSSTWYYHNAYVVAGDEGNLIIEHNAAATTKNANQNVYSIDLVAGTLKLAVSTFGFGDGGAHLLGGCLIVGKNTSLVFPDGTDYDSFRYEKYDAGFFTHTNQTKEVIGIALADAVVGATDASIALLDGLKSTTALPTGTFIEKNGQYYLLDVTTTIGSPPKTFKKDAIFGGTRANYNTTANVSSRSYSVTHTGTNSAVQNHPLLNYPYYNHMFSKVCNANVTTTLCSISGSGALSGEVRFWNGYHTTYNTGWEIVIDGVVFFKKLNGNETQGTAGYYGMCNLGKALPSVSNYTLFFEKSMEIKCVTPTASSTNWCAFNLYTRT